jgi:hypothetical protein
VAEAVVEIVHQAGRERNSSSLSQSLEDLRCTPAHPKPVDDFQNFEGNGRLALRWGDCPKTMVHKSAVQGEQRIRIVLHGDVTTTGK